MTCLALRDAYGYNVAFTFGAVVAARAAWVWREEISRKGVDTKDLPPLGENDLESVRLAMQESQWCKSGQHARMRIRGEVRETRFVDLDDAVSDCIKAEGEDEQNQ